MVPMTATELRVGDVFAFAYSEESWNKARTGLGHGDLRWAFDGQLVFRDGALIDSYWGLGGNAADGRQFSFAEAEAKGTLTFLCNLNDVELIRQDEFPLYTKGDAFDLSYNHGCHKYFVRKRGATKNSTLMLAALNDKVSAAEHEIQQAVRALMYAVERRAELRPRIEAGEQVNI